MMAKVNVFEKSNLRTHQGAKAHPINPELQLRRSVMACLLWEKEFYEDGVTIADRIKELVPKVKPITVSKIASEARHEMKLRHVPLLITREMARHKTHREYVADTLDYIIQRADELTEFLAMYWMDGRQPVSAQVKKGLARAFPRFDAYQLAKYDRLGTVRLRDVLFLCHAKPKDKEQEAVWKKLIDGTLEPPDTWEVGLSSGADKKSTWTRLLSENKMGALAVLRNLRNFERDGVDHDLVKQALANMNVKWVLPFRFLTAARHAVKFEPDIEQAFFRCCESQIKLTGKTILIIDVSGSMYGGIISKYSEMDRANVACSLAAMVRELCENPVIYATAGSDIARKHETREVPARRGFALSDAIYGLCQPLGGGGIFLKQVMAFVKEKEKSADRIIVITDEQDCDDRKIGSPLSADTFGDHNYLINVASAQNGIGYGKWIHIDGWSESVIRYIQMLESNPTVQ